MNPQEQVEQFILPLIGKTSVEVHKGPLAKRMRTALTKPEPRNWQEEGAISHSFYDSYLSPEVARYQAGEIPFAPVVGRYLALATSLEDFYKKGRFGDQSLPTTRYDDRRVRRPDSTGSSRKSSFVLNAIISEAAERFAIDITDAVSKDDMELLRSVPYALSTLRQLEPHLSVGIPLLDHLHARVESLQSVSRWIDELKKNDVLQDFIHSSNKNDVLSAMRQLQKHLVLEVEKGVPMGIFDSPLFLDKDHVFTTYDRRLNLVDQHAVKEQESIAPTEVTFAHIAYGRRPSPTTSLLPGIRDVEIGPATIPIVHVPKEEEAVFRLGTDGKWYTYVLGQVTLREIFGKKSAENEALFLETFLLMRLYDLTGRPSIISEMPSITDFERELIRNYREKHSFRRRLGLGRHIEEGAISENPDYIRLLVTPRLIDHAALIGPDNGELSVEIVPDKGKQTPTENNIVYEKRKVPVSATLKRLPNGYSASNRAKDIARNFFGINELPEGWTIVSGHTGERIVRVNKDTGEMLVRQFIFKGADDDVIQRLQEMVAKIQRGENPHRRYPEGR